MPSLFQTIQQRKNTTTTPVVNPIAPVATQPKIQQNFGMWSAEGWVANSTVATKVNPVVKVTTPKTTVDYSTLDKWWLQDEIARLTFRMKTGNVTEDDAVNYNRLTRMLGDQNVATAWAIDTAEIDRLRAEQEQVRNQRMSADEQQLAAFKQAQQAQTAQRIAWLQEWGAKQREAAQTATSFSWFGRSTVNAEQQASIEKQTQQAIQYENAASDLAIQKYQAELEGASAEVLDAYDTQIAAAQWAASKINQDLQAEAAKANAAQSQLFGKTLEELIANSGVKVDVNDEAALKQFISIARNADWTVNESVVWSLPANYQAIVRAWVQNGIGKTSAIDWSKVKFQRIGGTNKAPIYGYIDPITGEVKQASGGQVALMQWSGWGWGWGGTGGWTTTTWWNIVNQTPSDLYDLSLTSKNKSKLSQTAVENLSSGKNDAINALNSLEKLLESWDYTSWPLWGIATLNPKATKTISANQKFGIAAQVVGKFLEWWKLAEWDIKRYKALLPDVSDTKEVAKNKLAEAKKLITENYNWQLDSSARAWYNVSNFNYITPTQTAKATTPTKTTAPVTTTWAWRWNKK